MGTRGFNSDDDDSGAREDSEENEVFKMPGEVGAVQAELIRLGKNVRSDLAEIRTELREGLSELRKDHEQRSQDLVNLRLQVGGLPTADRVRELEGRLDEHRSIAAKTDALIAWRDGTNGQNGAADRLNAIEGWKSWILGGLAVAGVVGTIITVGAGAWFTAYLERRDRENTAFVQQMIQQQLNNPNSSVALPPHGH